MGGGASTVHPPSPITHPPLRGLAHARLGRQRSNSLLALCVCGVRSAGSWRRKRRHGIARVARPPPIEALLTPLLNAFSTRQAMAPRRSWVLVLDDLQVIDAPAIHKTLATLIDYLPPQLHLV